jgi:hypothetical protein
MKLLVFVAAANAEPADHSRRPLDGNAARQSFPPALFLAADALAQILTLDYHRVRGVVRAHGVIVDVFVGSSSAAEHQEKRHRDTLFEILLLELIWCTFMLIRIYYH